MKAYKLVKKRGDNRRISLWVGGTGRTEYHIGKIATRKRNKNGMWFGPLCAIDTIENAIEYASFTLNDLNDELWEVEVEESDAVGVWSYDANGYRDQYFSPFPKGTILCDTVKLVRKIR